MQFIGQVLTQFLSTHSRTASRERTCVRERKPKESLGETLSVKLSDQGTQPTENQNSESRDDDDDGDDLVKKENREN